MPDAGGQASAESIHATCVIVGEAGILIRGPSGAGKSTLARQLIEDADSFACLVADDRVRLCLAHGRIVARPVPAIAGRLEIRGIGLVRVPHEPACVVRLVVDLRSAEPDRLPESLTARLMGVEVPQVTVTPASALSLVRWRLRGKSDTDVTE